MLGFIYIKYVGFYLQEREEVEGILIREAHNSICVFLKKVLWLCVQMDGGGRKQVHRYQLGEHCRQTGGMVAGS